jgi:hypothetical protein
MRPNKLSLETHSNQVLEFEGKARANQIGAPFRCFQGKPLLFLPNDWKVIASYKHSSLFGLIYSDEGKMFYKIDRPGPNVVKLFTSVIYECS